MTPPAPYQGWVTCFHTMKRGPGVQCPICYDFIVAAHCGVVAYDVKYTPPPQKRAPTNTVF